MTTNQEKNRFERVGDVVSIFQRSGRWYGNFQHNGRQHRISLNTTSKKEARRRAIKIEAEIVDGRYRRTPQPPAIATAIEEYLEFLRAEQRSPKTMTKYQQVLDRLADVAQRHRAITIADVHLKLLDNFRGERTQAGAAVKTLYTETVIIRQLVKFAFSRGRIAVDPLHGLKLKKPRPAAQPCWTPAEVEKILQTAREPERWKFAVLAGTGMRVGELKHLTWNDVDFERNLLHVRPKGDWQPKTGDQRAIPLGADVRSILEILPKRSVWVFPAAPSAKYPKGDHQFSERHLLVSLKRVLKKIGLQGHLHTFRHAFISNALTQGVPEAVVRQWVGHVDRDIIKHYTHIADTASQAAMRQLGGVQRQHLRKGETRNDDRNKEAKQAHSQHNERSAQNG